MSGDESEPVDVEQDEHDQPARRRGPYKVARIGLDGDGWRVARPGEIARMSDPGNSGP